MAAKFPVGAYSIALAGTTLGLLEGVVRIQSTWHAQDIRSIRTGDSVIDGVYRGGDHFILAIVKERNTATKSEFDPYDPTAGDSGVIGRLQSDIAKVLLLTPKVGTPAATLGPLTRTYSRAIVSPEHNIEQPFGTEDRNIPMVWRGYPDYDSVSDNLNDPIVWFVDT